MKKKLIIVGAGYAGIEALRRLASTDLFTIKLFDIQAYHYMQTEVYDYIANESDFSKITVDLFSFCAGLSCDVEFIKKEVISIDKENKEVSTDTHNYEFDYLLLCSGAKTRFISSIKGLRQYAHGIKILDKALYFKQRFEHSLFMRIKKEAESCNQLNIVVAGAGLSGVEIAAQMASFSNEFYKNNSFLCNKLSIVLIDAY